jgi:hypothetical protein
MQIKKGEKMKLSEYLNEKRWNCAIFAREYNLNGSVVRKVVLGIGSINLDTALQIEAATKGKVRVWDMSANAGKIKELYGYPAKKKDKQDNEGNVEAEQVT